MIPVLASSSLVVGLAAALAGQGMQMAPDPGDERTYDGSSGELEVRTPRVVEPAVDVDGDLGEDAWSRAAILTGFTQFEPTEGVPASQRTEVLVFVSDDAVYLGIRAHDSDPDGIRATLAERDRVARTDDFVRILLDTFDDQRRAYAFTVNAYGVQQDGLWLEGGGGGRRRDFGPPIDDNPDFIWESGGRFGESGWTAELRIPFKSLRFPDAPRQAWGINVFRTVQRTGFQQSWAPISGDVANRLSQSGRLTGLRDLDAGLFLEMNPVLTGRRVGSFEEEAGRLVHGDPEGEVGFNATYGLTSNLTLDATYNPDFSQVEADAGQIAVNERFALFFPEKRPFFLEGTEIFQLPAQLIFTRSIVEPVGGAKITGKVGSLNLGYLGAVDESGEGDDAVVNILRLRQDVGGSSTVGALYTDRTRSGDVFNRVGGADLRLVLGRRYTLSVLGAGSWTGEKESGTVSGTFLQAEFERTGRAFSFEASLEDAAPDFVAGSGFLRRIGDTQLRAESRINWYGPPGALVERWGPDIRVQGFWDHDRFWEGGSFKEGEVELGGNLSFRNNITVGLNLTRSRFDFAANAYEGLFVEDPEGGAGEPFRPHDALFSSLDGVRLFFFFNNWERVRGNVRGGWKEVPVFDRGLGVPVEPGEAWSGNLSLNFFPTPALRAELGLRHETIFRSGDGSRYSSATIPRVRAQYQFSRALFVRTILEYASQEREALLDPETGRPLLFCEESCEARSGSEDYDVHIEGLLSYEPSPGTVFFVGYTRDMIDDDAFAFRDVQARADGLFLKVSYRFRL